MTEKHLNGPGRRAVRALAITLLSVALIVSVFWLITETSMAEWAGARALQ